MSKWDRTFFVPRAPKVATNIEVWNYFYGCWDQTDKGISEALEATAVALGLTVPQVRAAIVRAADSQDRKKNPRRI